MNFDELTFHGKRLKRVRNRSGHNQNEFAVDVCIYLEEAAKERAEEHRTEAIMPKKGVSQSDISNYETEQQHPQPRIARAIVDILAEFVPKGADSWDYLIRPPEEATQQFEEALPSEKHKPEVADSESSNSHDAEDDSEGAGKPSEEFEAHLEEQIPDIHKKTISHEQVNRLLAQENDFDYIDAFAHLLGCDNPELPQELTDPSHQKGWVYSIGQCNILPTNLIIGDVAHGSNGTTRIVRVTEVGGMASMEERPVA